MSRWILFLYRMPREPSAPRVAVWRALKRMEDGAYLQDGVFAIRHSPLHAQALDDLAHDVRNDGGEATVVETSKLDDEPHFKERLDRGKKE